MARQYFFFLAILFMTLITGCRDKQQADFSKYISGYTSGVLKSSSPVCIYLSQAPDKNFQPGSSLPSGLLTLSPAINGETILKDDHTVEFIPSEPFRNGTNYTANFHLGALCKVPEKFSHFRFQFDIVPLTVVFEPGELKAEPDDDIKACYKALTKSMLRK